MIYNLTLKGGTYDMSSENPALVNNVPNGFIQLLNNVPNIAGTNVLNIYGPTTGTPAVIITNNASPTISATYVSHVHISYLNFQRDVPTTTMGLVTDVSTPGQISFTVPTGFPDPLTLYKNSIADNQNVFDGSTAFRAYKNLPSPTLVDVANNYQMYWGGGTRTGYPNCTLYLGHCQPTQDPNTGVWTIYFDDGDNTSKAPSDAYNGNFVCLKPSGPQGAYVFNDAGASSLGTDVGFDHVTWQDQARGVFRQIAQAYVTNSSVVERAPISGQNYCLSVVRGGPQFNQPHDAPYNVLAKVDNFTATNTGDDTIAIFNDTNNNSTIIGSGSTITNSTIAGSFARDVNLTNSCLCGCSGAERPEPGEREQHHELLEQRAKRQ